VITELNEIHFHDSVLYKVVENTHDDSLEFHVEYPIDWDRNLFETRLIVFRDILEYSVVEEPFHGQPTLLDWALIDGKGGRRLIKFQTNAGHRSFHFRTVELVTPGT